MTYAARSYVTYADATNDSTILDTCYCERWDDCQCDIVPVGIHTSIQRVIVHTYVHGTWVWCADDNCTTCRDTLPF